MKKFLMKIFIFLLVFTVSVGLFLLYDFLFIGNQYLGNYQASILDKIGRLKSVKGPKIILVGDSNICFGIDSAEIEREFGKPVVDLGLHAKLGNAFHEKMARQAVSEGDIVIICHTTYADDGKIMEPSLAWITIEKHVQLWGLMSAKDILPMAKTYLHYFREALDKHLSGEPGNEPPADTVYSRAAFNEYGDVAIRPEKARFRFTETSVPVPGINDICTDRLNEMNRFVEERGAVMLIAGFPIGYGEYTPPAQEFEEFERELRDRVDCDVISHYTDYFFPYEVFYDTRLHLRKEGVEMRTRQLIKDLHEWENGSEE